MYICDECDAVFEEPIRKQEYSEEYGDSTAYYCPHCGSEEYTADDECPVCHSFKIGTIGCAISAASTSVAC